MMLGLTMVAIGAGVGLWRARAHPSAVAPDEAPAVAASPRRLAVIPFENVGDSAEAYFADGITDKVVRLLDRLAGLESGEQVAFDQILMLLLSASVLGERFAMAA
jgi:hypothetical protein